MYFRNVSTEKRLKNSGGFVGSEVFAEVIMKTSIFWDIKPYSPLKINQRFG
jgi:hypothetical protein